MKEENFSKSSRGALLFLIETAYTILQLMGERKLAEEMRTKILKAKTDKEIYAIVKIYERLV